MQDGLRISQLAERADVPVATIKFYLREGLLPRGVAAGQTQATYSDDHVRRLRLIRTLTELGGLTLAETRRAVEGIDAASTPRALRALGPSVDESAGLPEEAVDRFIEDLGWQVDPTSPGRRLLARALVALREAGYAVEIAVFRPHARAADWLVSEEEEIAGQGAEGVVAVAVAFDAASVALRHLAWEHRTSPTRARSRAAI